MGIYYKIQSRKNPMDPTAPAKFYAEKSNQGEFTFKRLADYVAFGTSVSRTDALSVLSGLTEVMVKELADGKTIRFGDFGSFRLTLRSEGSELAEHVTHSNIKGARIHFYPGEMLRECLMSLKYAKDPLFEDAEEVS